MDVNVVSLGLLTTIKKLGTVTKRSYIADINSYAYVDPKVKNKIAVV